MSRFIVKLTFFIRPEHLYWIDICHLSPWQFSYPERTKIKLSNIKVLNWCWHRQVYFGETWVSDVRERKFQVILLVRTVVSYWIERRFVVNTNVFETNDGRGDRTYFYHIWMVVRIKIKRKKKYLYFWVNHKIEEEFCNSFVCFLSDSRKDNKSRLHTHEPKSK